MTVRVVGVLPSRAVVCTAKVESDFEVTVPKAALGRAVASAFGLRRGRGLVEGSGAPEGRAPPPKPLPKPPLPVHPVVSGLLIITFCAVISPSVAVVPGAPVTSTQSPTFRLDTVVCSVWVKVVDPVKLTVTWPTDGFCTWIAEPVTAAAVPVTPGGPAGAGLAPGFCVDTVAVVEPLEPPPQAAMASEDASNSPVSRPTVTRGRRAADRTGRAAGPAHMATLNSDTVNPFS